MFTPPNMSRVKCHDVSRVKCHMSHVTFHMSRVTCHVSAFFSSSFFSGQRSEAYRWRVCYQRGLPHLVISTTKGYGKLWSPTSSWKGFFPQTSLRRPAYICQTSCKLSVDFLQTSRTLPKDFLEPLRRLPPDFL